ncbi:MAG: hypothetical protein Fur0024_5160 [Patescibacteria group bacterium]
MNFDLYQILFEFGYIVIFIVIFFETALPFGFVLPGDAIAFSSGFLASQKIFNIWIIFFLVFLSAVLGDNFSYYIGKTFGMNFLNEKKNKFLKEEIILSVKNFYQKHGRKSIFLSRFVPFARSISPIISGATGTPYSRFFFFNTLSCLVWAIGTTFGGFLFGSFISIEILKKYLSIVFILILLILLAIKIFKNKIV